MAAKEKVKLELRAKWAESFKGLVGRKITSVWWMRPSERMGFGWDRAPIVLGLDDGTLLFPSMDDEGNDAGALFVKLGVETRKSGMPTTAPVI